MAWTPNPDLQQGQQLGDFEVTRVRPVEEIRAVAYEVRHPASGARILHLHADDPENLFSVSFRTPPPDDTGVPHIIEHSVLSGSERFPVRDPFFEMVKMSMATFINAMTGPDCTYYPVSSNVKEDLFNLAEVYFDAVFHPLLSEQALKKEGHHLVPADPNTPLGDLAINGIVYNEMKSAASAPEALLYYRCKENLFPDSVYGRNSGGDPVAIPDLTYDAFQAFYDQAYHPSNAYFVLYGDIDTRDFLDFLGPRLAAFSTQPAPPPITYQPRWAEPAVRTAGYPVAKGDELDEKTYLIMRWIAGDATDPAQSTALALLDRILLGNEAAPLKKALIGSKLGQALSFSGFFPVGIEATFGVGLKGSESARAAAFEELVLGELERLADSTFDPAIVEAAFQQAAYRCREIRERYPLDVMDRVLHAWIYDRDPLMLLSAGDHLDACRRRYAENPRLFNELIRERLIENPHRLTLTLAPDRDMQPNMDAEFATRMKAVRNGLSDQQVETIVAEAAELERQAGTPNSPEALSSLPQLGRRDLPDKPRHIPTSTEQLGNGVTLLVNDVFSNGVNYLRLDIDLAGLPDHLWPFVPRFTEGISKLGAAGMGYETLAQRIAGRTGGVWAGTSITRRVTPDRQRAWTLRFGLKALDEQIEPALDVLHDLVFALDPRDRARLEEIVVQSLAGCRSRLVQDAAHTARLHAARWLSREGQLHEILSGMPQLPTLETAVSGFKHEYDGLAANIEAIRDFALGGKGLTASFTGSAAALDAVRRALAAWGAAMGREGRGNPAVDPAPFATPPREGLAAPIQVAHCTQIVPAPHGGEPEAPLLGLAMSLLRVDYMVHELRFKGNAYGASCSYSGASGEIALGSYADPHIVRTLGVFAGLPDYIRGADWTETELTRAIISTLKQDHEPIRPDSATAHALAFHALGVTREWRERRYERILGATPGQVKDVVLSVLDQNLSRAPICVASNREKLEAANSKLGSDALTIEDIVKS